MSRPARTEFLDRKNYRQRRYRDGACMMPVFGIVLMVLPLMWPRDTADQSLTSSGILYLFGVWLVLVLVAFALSRVVQVASDGQGDEDGSGKSEP